MKALLTILLSILSTVGHLFMCLWLVPLSFKEFIRDMQKSVEDDGLFAIFITFLYLFVFMWFLFIYYLISRHF